MEILLVFSILFVIGTGYNVFVGDFSNVPAQIIISIFLFSLYMFFRSENIKSEKFIIWALNNKEKVRIGSAQYKDHMVDLETVVTQYQFCLSFIVFSVKVRSRFFLKDDLISIPVNIIYTLCTLVFGWWGLLWGPIYTIQTLYRNLVGGHKTILKDMISIN